MYFNFGACNGHSNFAKVGGQKLRLSGVTLEPDSARQMHRTGAERSVHLAHLPNLVKKPEA